MLQSCLRHLGATFVVLQLGWALVNARVSTTPGIKLTAQRILVRFESFAYITGVQKSFCTQLKQNAHILQAPSLRLARITVAPSQSPLLPHLQRSALSSAEMSPIPAMCLASAAGWRAV